MKNKTVIGWWSGGVTSAVTCKICIDLYGLDNVRIIFMDTKNEDDDTYRFKKDCEKWYGTEIESITGLGKKYASIQDVWIKNKSLNVAKGAICSSSLKLQVRKRWQKENDYRYQAFGFEFDAKEFTRAKALSLSHPDSKPIYPLIFLGHTKMDCIDILSDAAIEVPQSYKLGFTNNNCFKTMCVQGGVGYWQKVSRDMPEKFDAMANMEHKLTGLKGKPVTMLRDQSEGMKRPVFLKPHPDYPDVKDISQMKGREPEPLFDCNGFCGTNDLIERSSTEREINYGDQLDIFNK